MVERRPGPAGRDGRRGPGCGRAIPPTVGAPGLQRWTLKLTTPDAQVSVTAFVVGLVSTNVNRQVPEARVPVLSTWPAIASVSAIAVVGSDCCGVSLTVIRKW